MKKRFGRAILGVLTAALLCGAPVYAAQSPSIGGKTAHIVSIPMDGTYTGRVVTAYGTVNSDVSAAELIDSAAASGDTVAAAINGMFFNSYYKTSQAITFPDNTPLLLTGLVQNGRIIAGGGEENCIGFTADGKASIDRVNVNPEAYVNGNGPVRIWTVNNKNDQPDAVILITEEMSLPYAIAAGSTAALIQNGVVSQVLTGGSVTLTQGQQLLVFNAAAAASHAGWSLLPAVGSTVTVSTKLTAKGGGDWSGMTSIAGGGRMLVYNGAVVSADASFNATLDGDPKQSATGVALRSFIAVTGDGQLLMGTVSSSFNQIAAYLQSVGAVNAVSLDGGASSMLYEGGTGFVTPAGRELASAIVIVKSSGIPATACPITVDGKAHTLDAYVIDSNNYVKLRDVAMVLNGTGKQFNAAWDDGQKLVSLTSKTAYVPVGGELAGGGGRGTPVRSDSPILLDGTAATITAYTIGGNNYVKLRDLCKLINVGVTWTGAGQPLVLDTSASYTD